MTLPGQITGVHTVGVPVTDQNRAIDFYVGTLGFDKRLDADMGGGRRWIEVAPGGSATTIALVAAHDWDCHGAKRAGLITGFVTRKSGGFGALFEPPDVVGEDLTEVAARLLAMNS